MPKHKICVYAICKNEEKFVKEWVDNMSEADYIVVMDTGSTDNTVKLLEEDERVTKVEVHPINPWRFDVARNESMKLVPDDADILVCTDLDERFTPGWAEIVRANWTSKTNRGYYKYAWSHSDTGAPTDIFVYDKMHTRDFKWIFPVHEVLDKRSKSVKTVAFDFGDSIMLHHYQDLSKDRKDYFDLLKLSVEENPDDSHVRMLLAREYLIRQDNDNALIEYDKVLKMPDVDAPNKRLVLLESLLKVGQIYQAKQENDTALWYFQEFIKEDPTYREPYLFIAEIYNDMGMYTLGQLCAEGALRYAVRKYDWIEEAKTWQELPYDVLGFSAFKLNEFDKALEYYDKALDYAPNDLRILQNYRSAIKASASSEKTKG